MNRNYHRGRQKEYELKERLEKEGFIVFRTSGSHGVCDLIAVKPRPDGKADLFPEVRFIQIKSSIHFKVERMVKKFIDHLIIDWYQMPIKTASWYEENKTNKRKVRAHRQRRL